MDFKRLGAGVAVKADNDRGEITAAFVSYGIKDADGDIVLPDAIENGSPAIVGGFGHTVWKGSTPLGAGTIEVTPKHAILHAKMWIDEIPEARSAFYAIKGLGEQGLAQFSMGFTTQDAGPGEYNGVRANLLKRITVAEVSPVLRGAQPGTHLVGAKGYGGAPAAVHPATLAALGEAGVADLKRAAGNLGAMAWHDMDEARRDLYRAQAAALREDIHTAEVDEVRQAFHALGFPTREGATW